MLKLLVSLVTIIAKYKGMDYITICWFDNTGFMSITGYTEHKKVYDWYKRKGVKWHKI